MKKSNRVISLFLALVMLFSASCVSAAASAVPESARDSAEQLIQNENLAGIADWLITGLNNAKTNVTGTLLKLLLSLLLGGDLPNGNRNIQKLSDMELAKILMDWLDANLPEWTSEITSQDSWNTVQSIVSLLGVKLDLKSVDGIVETLYSICNKVNTDPIVGAAFGDFKQLKGGALKGVRRAGGDLNIIYALFQWLKDNLPLIKAFVKGGFGSDGLSAGNLLKQYFQDDLDNVTRAVKSIPDFIKSCLYCLIDEEANPGTLGENARGPWGASDYSGYTADQLLASAFVVRLSGSEKTVGKKAADEILGLTFYELLTRACILLYPTAGADFLNGLLKDMILKSKDYPALAAVFNLNYSFTDDTFDEVFKKAEKGGILSQANNAFCVLLKTVLSDSAYKAVSPKTGSVEVLNENLTKVCRFFLPILSAYSKEIGVDFAGLTDTAIREMELPELAHAMMKFFFPVWFKDFYKADPGLLKNAKNQLQLYVALIQYTLASSPLMDVWKEEGIPSNALLRQVTADNIGKMTDAECLDLIGGYLTGFVAYVLSEVWNDMEFSFHKVTADWGWRDCLDEIVDWALNYIKGFPAVAVEHLETKAGEYDGNGPFYKLNVVLNELIDFSFLNGVNDETFRLDTETLLFDALLGNQIRTDVAGTLNVFARNDRKDNILNARAVPCAIGIVDRILTALFSHECGEAGEFTKRIDCTNALTGSYDPNNGHYIGKTEPVKGYEAHDFVEKPEKNVAPTCGANGTRYFECTKCGAVKKETITATGKHTWNDDPIVQPPTCATEGIEIYTCSVCGKEDVRNIPKTGEHVWDDGIITATPTCAKEGKATFTCSVCGATKTEPVAKTEDHVWNTGKITTPATCKDEGVKTFTCAVCGTTKTEPVPKTEDHVWDKGSVTTPATCKDEGVKTFTCTVCGTTKTEPVAKTEEHVWDEGKVTKEATTEDEGVMTFTCTVCGATKETAIEKIPVIEQTDPSTRIAVSYASGAFSASALLKVEKIETAGDLLTDVYTSVAAYDISMVAGTNKEQPKTAVTVRIPVPKGFRADAIALFHVTEEGAQEAVSFRIEKNSIVFTAESFSVYAVADTSTKVIFTPGDVNSDGNIDAADARLALRRTVRLETYAELTAPYLACDADGDGDVTSKDARLILRAGVKLEDPAAFGRKAAAKL